MTKPWQQTYQSTQTVLLTEDEPLVTLHTRYLRPCGAMAPESGVRFCLKPLPGCDSFCQQIDGHRGAHTKRVNTCNRPAGHEGGHEFLTLDSKHGYQRLAVWT